MANTTIKITQLPSIGNGLSATTILPVVNTTGTATTDKVSVGAVANFILTEAGNTLQPAFLAELAYSVANAAQPNITSVGNLTGLTINNVNNFHVPGGDNGYYLQTDGGGNLAWVAGGGSGNGEVGGSDTQIQFNNAGNFGGDPNLEWVDGNIVTTGIKTDGYFYANGDPYIINTGDIVFNGDEISSTTDVVNILGNDYAQLQSNNTYIWVEDGEADIEVNGNRWVFNNAGNLTLPGNTFAINYANGQQVPLGGGGGLPLSNGTSNFDIATADGNATVTADGETWTFGTNGVLALPNETNIYGNGQFQIDTVGGFQLTSFTDNVGSGAQTWLFDSNGDLNLPGNTVIQNGGGITYQVSPGYEWDLHSSDGNVYIGSVEDMAYIDTYSPNIGVRLRSNENDWIFGPDGNLTLPDIANPSINYANGDPYGGGAGPVTPTANGTFTTLPDFLEFVGGTYLRTGQTSEGVFFDGDAGDPEISYPVRSNFSINGTTKVTVTVDMVVNDECSDFGLCIFEEDIQPEWAWDPNPTRIAASYNCTTPYIYTLNDEISATWDIPAPGTYRVRFTYDPSNTPNITLETLDTSNTVLNTISIDGTLNTSINYYIGFAADQDSTNLRTYIQNLNIDIDGGDTYTDSLQLSGGGNANTGNVTFDNINVIGTGNLHLQPDPANSGSYLDIFLTSGPDLHLVASAAANLILGKDLGANVMTSWDGNAYVQSWNLDTGNVGGVWTFGGDGNLTAPGNIIIDNGVDGNIESTGNVNVTANNKAWIFGTDGNLKLPSNTSSINYANGDPYGGGGGANTGNVTFSDQVVIGTGDIYGGSGLFLAPGANSTGNLQYLRVRGGDVATHIHFDTGNNQYFDQYFGADAKFVKLEANGNVVINADDFAGNGATWTFGRDGGLIFPDGGGGNPTTEIYTTSGGSQYTFESYYAGGRGSGTYLQLDADNGIVTIRPQSGANVPQWTFSADGTTTFPTLTVDLHNGGNQTAQTLQFGDPTQQAIITGPTPAVNDNAQRIIIQGQRGTGTGEGGDVYVWGGDSDVNGGDIKIYAGDAEVSGYGGYINIDGGTGIDGGGGLSLTGGQSADGQGGQITITPGYSGNANGATLSLNGGQAAGNGGGVNITAGAGTANGGQVTITGGQSALGLSGYGNVVVSAGASQWKFDNTGNLVLPSNTFAIKYANGTQAQFSQISNGNSNVSVPTSSDNVYITTNNGTSKQWIFNTNGSLRTPGNIDIYGAINFPQQVSNINWSTYSIELSQYGRITTNVDFFANANVIGAQYLKGDGSNISNISGSNIVGNVGNALNAYAVAAANVTGLGNLALLNKDGNSSNVLYGNGVFASVPATYGNSNVATFLASFGSNTISTTGNINGGNITVTGTANTGISSIVAGVTNTLLPNTIASFSANVNSYIQVTLQNKSNGADATADYIITADNGSDTVNYADFGIINSGYDNGTPTNSLGNIVYAADTYLYAQGNTGNASQSGGNLAIGTTVPGKNVKIFAGGVNNSSIIANIANTGMTVTGNITVANGSFVGNGAGLTNVTVNASGNIQGTSSNVSLIAGSYTYTFDNTGILTLPAPASGNEGGEIDFTKAANSSLSGNTVVIDQYIDRLRFFESGGTSRGVYIDLTQAAAGVGTLLNNRVSAFVNAGTYVTMDNIKATVSTSGNRGLVIAAVSTTFVADVGGTYGAVSSGGGASVNNVSYTTTPGSSVFGWSFFNAGDMATYTIHDITNTRAYRITMQIGNGYNNNMISIERLI